jgi:predicted AAA+ superfamily ATPase
MFIARDATPTLERLAAGFPVLWLTGPRQSGKTTLARAMRPDLPYVNLERPDERAFAQEDPRAFLAAHPDGAILDEVQYAPDLLSWLQAHADEDGRMGRWLLTGSQQPAIAQGISQSLAGRVGRIELLPLSGHELSVAGLLPSSLDDVLFTGGYPALFDRDVSPTDWLGNYVATYVERDVRMMAAVRHMDTFTRFVRLCAARSGQLLNMSALGNDAGVSLTAVREWLSILRATFVVDLVEPFSPNVTTRVVKTPKLLFLDVGLMAYLVGITQPSQIATHPLRGALFETWGITEQVKAWRNVGNPQRAHFLRDKRGAEVDLVFPVGELMHGVEFKSGTTVSGDWTRVSDQWARRPGIDWAKPTVVYGGDADSRRSSADYLGWRTYARTRQ